MESILDEQFNFWDRIATTILKNGRLSHAYLLEKNGYDQSREIVYQLATLLITEKAKDEKCHTMIKQQTHPDFLWIEPDGQWIKKEQLQLLKQKFKTKSVDGTNRVYVIFQADKLNKASANSLLKFLEEPEEGIIAILVVDHRYQLLPTIVSRCQIYTLEGDRKNHTSFSDEELFAFLHQLEKYQGQAISFVTPFLKTLFANKEKSQQTVTNMENVYQVILERKLSGDPLDVITVPFLKDYWEQVSIYDIINKLKVIHHYDQELLYNVNLRLWLDAFILSFGGEFCV